MPGSEEKVAEASRPEQSSSMSFLETFSELSVCSGCAQNFGS